MTKEPVPLAALSDIYENRYARFLRVAEAIVGDAEVARDVVQEAFVRLIRSRFEFRGEGSVDGWIWRTVVNAAKNARRDRPPAHLRLDELADVSARNGHQARDDVGALVAALPERQRH